VLKVIASAKENFIALCLEVQQVPSRSRHKVLMLSTCAPAYGFSYNAISEAKINTERNLIQSSDTHKQTQKQ
jgi:hypothetical protein